MKIHPFTVLLLIPVTITLIVFALPLVLILAFEGWVNDTLDSWNTSPLQFMVIMLGSEILWLVLVTFVAKAATV